MINMIKAIIVIILALVLMFSCETDHERIITDTTDQITIDSLVAGYYSVKAWDTTTVICYARGENLVYGWECDHGNFNGEGSQIKYAAGECCVGLNTITCTVSNETGQVTGSIQVEVTSYFGGGK